MSEIVLNVIAENIKKEHVAEQMHQSAMEKHAGEEWLQGGLRVPYPDTSAEIRPGIVALANTNALNAAGGSVV